MFDVKNKFFAVGLRADVVNANAVRGLYCPEGGCGRGLIPHDEFHGAKSGFTNWAGSLGAPISLAAALSFESEDDAVKWLNSSEGQKFSEGFQNVLIIRTSR